MVFPTPERLSNGPDPNSMREICVAIAQISCYRRPWSSVPRTSTVSRRSCDNSRSRNPGGAPGGKTTLARQLVSRHRGPTTSLDLENAEDLFQLQDARLALEPLRGLIVLDEVQRRPDIFAALRVLVDQPRGRRRFLVLGSAAPELLRQTSETLAGAPRTAAPKLLGEPEIALDTTPATNQTAPADPWTVRDIEPSRLQSALAASCREAVYYSITSANAERTGGKGWRLTVAEGWRLGPGERAGDWRVVRR
jgi:hypothetical protein